jgi:osmotically inducible lipoprotein OsmB|uniref:Glycine-zipper-containing OmpA-like membrane domain-containing protein n=1 Tax=Desulfobacca acetoxidans TaxID=60893 RepID=A0A7V6A3U8_9BACT
MKRCLILLLVVCVFAGACASGYGGLGPTASSVLTGGALGAGGGALIGAAAGNAGTGAAIGAGAGVLGGFLYDQWRRNQGLGPYGQ